MMTPIYCCKKLRPVNIKCYVSDMYYNYSSEILPVNFRSTETQTWHFIASASHVKI